MKTFEDFLRLHCNIECNKEGNEVVNSSLSAVMIAFDEWKKDILPSKNDIKKVAKHYTVEGLEEWIIEEMKDIK